MAKPTTIPRWASVDQTKVAVPSNAVLDAGWDPATQPPAQWFNWFMFHVYLWIAWLNAYETTAHDWSGAQQIFRNFAIDGDAYIEGTVTFNETAEIDTNGAWRFQKSIIFKPGDYSGADAPAHIYEAPDSGSGTYALIEKTGVSRRYVNVSDGTHLQTYNAKWNGTNWVRDITQRSSKLVINPFGDSAFYTVASGGAGSTFADSSFVRQYRIGDGEAFDSIALDKPMEFLGAPLPSDTAQLNVLSSGLVCKAWAKIRIAAGVYSILAGQNVATLIAGSAPTAGQFKLGLAAAVPRATRTVTFRPDTPGFEGFPYDFAGTLGADDNTVTIEVASVDSSGNRATYNLSTGTVVGFVHVFGYQTL